MCATEQKMTEMLSVASTRPGLHFNKEKSKVSTYRKSKPVEVALQKTSK
jgi:hypothetical protein